MNPDTPRRHGAEESLLGQPVAYRDTYAPELLFPIAREVGVHEIHYAMVVILAMGVGLFAPPFGVGYYAACAVGRASPDEGMKPIVGYLLALVVGLIVVAAVPWISIGFLD